VDWSCEVHTLFREENLGCRKAVSSAITWFFENEERGIILEDDCLPHATFFTFCETMLRQYENDNRVRHIGGANFQKGIQRGDGDYYFSNLTHVWGWASWRRVWKNYDVNMPLWPLFKKEGHLKHLFPHKRILKNITTAFDKTFSNMINTWDYQYFFSNLVQNGLSIIPNVNLISNIGYNAEATHPSSQDDEYSNMEVNAIERFNAPSIFRPCHEADIFTLGKDTNNTIALIRKKFFPEKLSASIKSIVFK
jgi:hypothetical protein